MDGPIIVPNESVDNLNALNDIAVFHQIASNYGKMKRIEAKGILEDENYKLKVEKVRKELSKHFHMFARNSRWGTCSDCPRDSDGMIYPEFCAETNRFDHQLLPEQLFQLWTAQTKRDYPQY